MLATTSGPASSIAAQSPRRPQPVQVVRGMHRLQRGAVRRRRAGQLQAHGLAPGQQRLRAGRRLVIGAHLAALQEEARRVGELRRVPECLQTAVLRDGGTLVRFARGWNRLACRPMRLSRRALMLAAAAAAPLARAAQPATLVCPLPAAPGVLVPGVSDAFGDAAARRQDLSRPDALRTRTACWRRTWRGTAELSPDRLTYRFRLRAGVTWHDSGGFDADDVVFSLARFHAALQPGLRLDRVRVGDGRTRGPSCCTCPRRTTLPAAAGRAVAADRAAARARPCPAGRWTRARSRRSGAGRSGWRAGCGWCASTGTPGRSRAGRDRLPDPARPGGAVGAGTLARAGTAGAAGR